MRSAYSAFLLALPLLSANVQTAPFRPLRPIHSIHPGRPLQPSIAIAVSRYMDMPESRYDTLDYDENCVFHPPGFIRINGTPKKDTTCSCVDKLIKEIHRREGEAKRVQLGVLKHVMDEISRLRTSNQRYRVIAEECPFREVKGKSVACTTFNFTTGEVIIYLPPDTGVGLFSHELLHAYQFEQGSNSLADKATGDLFLLDQTDEYAAYERQAFFGDTVNNFREDDVYKHLPAKAIEFDNFRDSANTLLISNLIKKNDTSGLRKLSSDKKQAFRVTFDHKTWVTIYTPKP